MKIIYSCPFVPAEWIKAYGISPSRIMPRSMQAQPMVEIAPGMCPYVHAFINAAISHREAAGIVVTTLCDQMRRASEIIERNCGLPVFLMNVPSTWQTPNAQKLYISELERLGRFMTGLGGVSPTPDQLTEVMCEYDEMRDAVRGACGHLLARKYSELMADFHENGIVDTTTKSEKIPNGVPLALVGGPLLRDHFAVFDFAEQAGGDFVLDATETGERTMPAPFDRRRLKDDPLMALADAYFGNIPDASRRPNSELYKWLGHEIKTRGIRGIVFRRYVWCDMWHAEAQRMKEWAGLPFLDLDVSDDVNELSRMSTRLQAFMEMLT